MEKMRLKNLKTLSKKNPEIIETWNNIGTKFATKHCHSSREIEKFYKAIIEKGIFVHVEHVPIISWKRNDLPDIDFRMYEGGTVPVIQIIIYREINWKKWPDISKSKKDSQNKLSLFILYDSKKLILLKDTNLLSIN